MRIVSRQQLRGERECGSAASGESLVSRLRVSARSTLRIAAARRATQELQTRLEQGFVVSILAASKAGSIGLASATGSAPTTRSVARAIGAVAVFPVIEIGRARRFAGSHGEGERQQPEEVFLHGFPVSKLAVAGRHSALIHTVTSVMKLFQLPGLPLNLKG